jgi:hypothetical protein
VLLFEQLFKKKKSMHDPEQPLNTDPEPAVGEARWESFGSYPAEGKEIFRRPNPNAPEGFDEIRLPTGQYPEGFTQSPSSEHPDSGPTRIEVRDESDLPSATTSAPQVPTEAHEIKWEGDPVTDPPVDRIAHIGEELQQPESLAAVEESAQEPKVNNETQTFKLKDGWEDGGSTTWGQRRMTRSTQAGTETMLVSPETFETYIDHLDDAELAAPAQAEETPDPAASETTTAPPVAAEAEDPTTDEDLPDDPESLKELLRQVMETFQQSAEVVSAIAREVKAIGEEFKAFREEVAAERAARAEATAETPEDDPDITGELKVGQTVRVFSHRLKFEQGVIKEIFTTADQREGIPDNWQQYYKDGVQYARVTVGEGSKAIDKIIDIDTLRAWQGNEVLQIPDIPLYERMKNSVGRSFTNAKAKLQRIKTRAAAQAKDIIPQPGSWTITAESTDPTDQIAQAQQENAKKAEKERKEKVRKERKRISSQAAGALACAWRWGAPVPRETKEPVKSPASSSDDEAADNAEPVAA